MSVFCRDTPLDAYSGDRRFILSVNSRTCRADSVVQRTFYPSRGTAFGSQHPCSMSYKSCDSSFRECGTSDILNPSVKCLFVVDSKVVLVGDSYLKCTFVIAGNSQYAQVGALPLQRSPCMQSAAWHLSVTSTNHLPHPQILE